MGKGKSFQLLVQPHYSKQPSHSVESRPTKQAAWHGGGGFLFFSCFGFRSGAVVQPCSHSGSPPFLPSKRPCHQEMSPIYSEPPQTQARRRLGFRLEPRCSPSSLREWPKAIRGWPERLEIIQCRHSNAYRERCLPLTGEQGGRGWPSGVGLPTLLLLSPQPAGSAGSSWPLLSALYRS